MMSSVYGHFSRTTLVVISLVMKIAVCLLALLGVALAENCNRVSDCVLTKCASDDFNLRCFDDHTCSCVPSRQAYSCSSASDCDESVIGSCNYNDHKWHCVDQTCHCRRYGR